jgi:hypothetical protein
MAAVAENVSATSRVKLAFKRVFFLRVESLQKDG